MVDLHELCKQELVVASLGLFSRCLAQKDDHVADRKRCRALLGNLKDAEVVNFLEKIVENGADKDHRGVLFCNFWKGSEAMLTQWMARNKVPPVEGDYSTQQMKGMRKFRDSALKLCKGDPPAMETEKLRMMIKEIGKTSPDPSFWTGVADAIPKVPALPLADFSDALHIWLLQDLEEEDALEGEIDMFQISENASISEQLEDLVQHWIPEIGGYISHGNRMGAGLAMKTLSKRMEMLAMRSQKLEQNFAKTSAKNEMMKKDLDERAEEDDLHHFELEKMKDQQSTMKKKLEDSQQKLKLLETQILSDKEEIKNLNETIVKEKKKADARVERAEAKLKELQGDGGAAKDLSPVEKIAKVMKEKGTQTDAGNSSADAKLEAEIAHLAKQNLQLQGELDDKDSRTMALEKKILELEELAEMAAPGQGMGGGFEVERLEATVEEQQFLIKELQGKIKKLETAAKAAQIASAAKAETTSSASTEAGTSPSKSEPNSLENFDITEFQTALQKKTEEITSLRKKMKETEEKLKYQVQDALKMSDAAVKASDEIAGHKKSIDKMKADNKALVKKLKETDSKLKILKEKVQSGEGKSGGASADGAAADAGGAEAAEIAQMQGRIDRLEKEMEQKDDLIAGLRNVRSELLEAREIYNASKADESPSSKSPTNKSQKSGDGRLGESPLSDRSQDANMSASTPRKRALQRQVDYFHQQAKSMEQHIKTMEVYIEDTVGKMNEAIEGGDTKEMAVALKKANGTPEPANLSVSAQMFQQLISEIQTLEVQKEDCEAEIRRLNKKIETLTGQLASKDAKLKETEKEAERVIAAQQAETMDWLFAAKREFANELNTDANDFLSGAGGLGGGGLPIGGKANSGGGFDEFLFDAFLHKEGGGFDFLGGPTQGRIRNYQEIQKQKRAADWAIGGPPVHAPRKKKKKKVEDEGCAAQ